MTKKEDRRAFPGVHVKISEDNELTVSLSAICKAQMEADPKMAAAMQDTIALIHQAHAGILSGQYDSFEEAMESLTGHRPERVEEDD